MRSPAYVISFTVGAPSRDGAREHAAALLEAVEGMIRSYREAMVSERRPIRGACRCRIQFLSEEFAAPRGERKETTMSNETPKVAAKDRRTEVDLQLVKPILAAAIEKADEKAKKLFSRSPSLLAAQIADEAQKQGIVKTREEWRFIYYSLKESVVPALFPKTPAKAA